MKDGAQIIRKRMVIDIASTLSNVIEEFFHKAPFDLRCIDWFSYHPDFYIKRQEKKLLN